MTRGRGFKCRAAWGSRACPQRPRAAVPSRRAPRSCPRPCSNSGSTRCETPRREVLLPRRIAGRVLLSRLPRPAKSVRPTRLALSGLSCFKARRPRRGHAGMQSCSMLPSARTSSLAQPNFLSAAELATGIFSDSGRKPQLLRTQGSVGAIV